MKKLISLIKASMTSGMNVFKIKNKNASSKQFLPFVLAFCLMFAIWSNANMILEELDTVSLEYVALSLFALAISIFTLIEGIYKSGALLFNCKDDDLLLSLPIKKSTVLFVRIFKFYVFELVFNSLFLVPVIIAYLRWVKVDALFFLTSFIMLLLLPIIPIVLSCIIGAITTGLSSRFKFKNLLQIISTMLVFLAVMYFSMNMDSFLLNIANNAKSVNEFITKLYYPAGVYANLAIKFNLKELLIFIIINIGLFVFGIFVLSKVYFKINSRMKGVITHKNKTDGSIKIKERTQVSALISKEITTFFKTPVFIINAGFGVVIYLIIVIVICFKYDLFLETITSMGTMNTDFITNNITSYIFLIIIVVSLTTSITSSMISLEGKKFNILKSLPVKTERILKSKIYASLLLVIPAFVIGDIILFIKLNISILESLILLILTLLLPLLSSLIGLIINLKYPKLDAENSAEVVKQSASSFISVMIGITIIFTSYFIISSLINNNISSLMILLGGLGIVLIIDLLLYLYLMKKGVVQFNQLNS